MKYIFDNVEKTIAKTLNEVPEEIKQKKAQMEKIQTELQNFLNFIKTGNFSKLVSEAIVDAENRQGKLQGEIQAMDFQRTNAFKAPPKEWIEFRLERFQETLNKNTKASALALKELLGTIELEPVQNNPVMENGNIIEQKPYYMAHSNIETLALLDQENKGANWFEWRTRSQPIRTLSFLPVKIKITMNDNIPLYQKLAPKIKELKALEMTNMEIAERLNVSRKTVMKSILF